MKSYKIKFIELTKLAYPIFLSFLLEIIFGIFDKMIIGRTNLEAFNAVSFMSTFLYVIIGALGIVTTCFNIIYNKKKSKKVLDLYLSFTLIIGILSEVIFVLFGKNIISFLYHLDGLSLKYAYEYLVVAGPTVLFNLWIFIFSSYFRSNNNTKIQARVTFISLLINLILDYVLVFGIFKFNGIGPVGAAVGTSVGLLFGLIYYLVKFKDKINIYFDKKEIKKMLKLYFPLLIDELFESTILTLFITGIVSKFSSDVIGVYNVIDTINGFVILITYAYSGAALTRALQTKDNTYQKIASTASFFFQGILSIFVIVFSVQIAKIITNQYEIINIIKNYILLGVLVQLVRCIIIPYKELLQGVNKEKFVLKVTIMYVILFIVLTIVFKILNILNLNTIYVISFICYIFVLTIYIVKRKYLEIGENS